MSTEQNHFTAGSGDLALSAFGTQITANQSCLFRSLFTYDVPPRKWLSTVNGAEEDITISTNVISSGGALNVKTGGVSGNITYLSSRRHPQYHANRGHLGSITAKIPTPSDNAVEDFGLFTDENGVFFRVHTDGKLYACIQSNGVLTIEDEITDLPADFDLTDLNSYHIQYQCGGIGNFRFIVGNKKSSKIEIVKELSHRTLGYSPTIQNPSLSAAYRVTSFGDEGLLVSGCCDITTEGGREGREQYVSAYTRNKSINGTDVPVLAVRSPNTIGSVLNTRDARLVRVEFSPDKKTDFTVWTTRDVTALTGASFSADYVGSYIEQDSSATALDTAKCQFVTTLTAQANDTKNIDNPDPERVDFFLIHGDYIIITGTVSSGTCSAVIEFGEEV